MLQFIERAGEQLSFDAETAAYYYASVFYKRLPSLTDAQLLKHRCFVGIDDQLKERMRLRYSFSRMMAGWK